VQGLDDSPSLNNAFKLIDSYDSLLQREAIRKDCEPKLPRLLEMFAAEVNDVYKVFCAGHDIPPVYSNMPPVAGALRWGKGLHTRIESQLQKLNKLHKRLWESEEAKEIFKQYSQLEHDLREYSDHQQLSWCTTVDVKTQDKLKQKVCAGRNSVSPPPGCSSSGCGA
jgi:hypothetical protein